MATQKEVRARNARVMADCLRETPHTAEELAEYFALPIRTIYRLLHDVDAMGVDLVILGTKQPYRYEVRK